MTGGMPFARRPTPRRVRACVLAAGLLAACAAAAADPYSSLVLSHHPVVYYRLGEAASASGAADAADAAGSPQQGAQNGTYHGFSEPPTASSGLGLAGPRAPTYAGLDAANACPHFDGADDYLSVPDGAALDITGALTLEAWVRPDGFSGSSNTGVVAKYVGDGNQRAYDLYVDLQEGGGAPGLVISPDGTYSSAATLTSGTPLATGTWTHLAATYLPGTAMRLWRNGQLDCELTSGVPGSVKDSSADLWIGVQYVLSNAFFDGYIDEVAVYDYALDDVDGDGSIDAANRVAAHYAAAVPEPLALGLLLAGACAAFARRRGSASG